MEWLVNMGKTWISSDFHFCHRSLTRGVSLWDDKSRCRDFDTIEEMNEAILSNINSLVKKDDEMYCLGDFCFAGVDNYKLREKINCKSIHYICGNHSNRHSKEYDPIMSCGNSVSSLFSSYGFYKEIFRGKTQINLFHYPISSWNGMAEGSIHCFGHCHYSPEDKYSNGGRSMDVGLDGNNLMPYLLDDVIDELLTKPIKREGHH